MAYRVVQQVRHDPAQRVRVPDRPQWSRPDLRGDRRVPRRDLPHAARPAAPRSGLVRPRRLVRPRQQQEVVDEPRQPGGVGQQVVGDRRPVGTLAQPLRHLQLGAHVGQRAAQLVRRVRRRTRAAAPGPPPAGPACRSGSPPGGGSRPATPGTGSWPGRPAPVISSAPRRSASTGRSVAPMTRQATAASASTSNGKTTSSVVRSSTEAAHHVGHRPGDHDGLPVIGRAGRHRHDPYRAVHAERGRRGRTASPRLAPGQLPAYRIGTSRSASIDADRTRPVQSTTCTRCAPATGTGSGSAPASTSAATSRAVCSASASTDRCSDRPERRYQAPARPARNRDTGPPPR